MRSAPAPRCRKPTSAPRMHMHELRNVEALRIDAMTAAAPLIEARGIHTYYGVSHILHGVDFCVLRGETVGLMGRNGMGKTTLLKSVLGLVRRPVGKMQGTVSVKGRDVTRAPPHAVALAGIAYVPEGRGIFPNLSVRENLVMAARAGADGRRDLT